MSVSEAIETCDGVTLWENPYLLQDIWSHCEQQDWIFKKKSVSSFGVAQLYHTSLNQELSVSKREIMSMIGQEAVRATSCQGVNIRKLRKDEGASLSWRRFKRARERRWWVFLLGYQWSMKVSWLLSLLLGSRFPLQWLAPKSENLEFYKILW